jgi:hypothetical protein
MVKVIDVIDYLILSPLIFSILFYVLSDNPYKSIVVYLSFIIFFSYWMIRIIFNGKYKELISGS